MDFDACVRAKQLFYDVINVWIMLRWIMLFCNEHRVAQQVAMNSFLFFFF